ncbi:Aste57867_18547 [Aphanomyces stellatus]|uniref:Aste57867_18547 protein n=1 Tax=Aphanomyces stellatus TaxID=120398 RepID=A0A485LAL8_9STRA|nr:hypothetical protein As57867_018485 [Aphanomyces stellatus]VFT95283.1 Aste57867_18547 [Aphanomyces stellatus]
MPAAASYMLTLVKTKQTVFAKLIPPKTRRLLIKYYHHYTPWLGFWLGLVMLFLTLVDFFANNWAFLDFCGNGLQFRTPVAQLASASDLASHYTFAHGLNYTDMSNIGQWMTDFSVTNMAGTTAAIYLLPGGTYTISSTMNFCNILAPRTYTVDLTHPVKLAATNDAVTFLRGDALSHTFTNDMMENLPTSTTKMDDLAALGFIGARVQADLRLTTVLPLVNTSATQTMVVKMYRIYSKAYCTGCTPIAELGHGLCNLTATYTDATQTLHVTRAASVVGSPYDYGLMFERSIYSTIGLMIKFVAIFFAVAGYLASRKTVQWQEVDSEKVETVWSKVVLTIAPKYFPHLSHAIRFDLFCFNSDIFVSLYCISTLLDMSQSIKFIRETNGFNMLAPRPLVSLQLFALSTRLLWLNVALVKLFKVLWNVVAPAIYSGSSRVMPFFNFSSVAMFYLSVILLYYVPPYIEYNNKGRFDVANNVERLDGVFVNFFDSFYVRGAASIAVSLVANVLGVLAFDHVVLHFHWADLKRNSLARQAIFNSTAVVCEFVADVHTIDNNVVMHVGARRLSTLQWFFMSHMLCFALPEKEMTKKKGGGASTAPSTTKGEQADGHDVMHTVGQAESGHLHLFDESLSDVKSLAFNIKILRNTHVTIK